MLCAVPLNTVIGLQKKEKNQNTAHLLCHSIKRPVEIRRANLERIKDNREGDKDDGTC